MATTYCDDGGSNTSPYDTWAKAANAYQDAATESGVGGTVYMDEDHRETFGDSKTFTIPAGLITIVAQTATLIPVTSPNATANLECTTQNDDMFFDGGVGYFYGISLKTTRTLGTQTAGAKLTYENSRVIATGDTGAVSGPNDGIAIEFVDSELSSYSFTVGKGGLLSIRGCSYEVTATSPTTLFNVTREGGTFNVQANDFSAYDGTNIFDFSQVTSIIESLRVDFHNNRMPSSFTWSAGRPVIWTSDGRLKAHANGNADEYYQIFEDNYGGYAQETVQVDRVGGATYDGTSLFSIGLHGNANTSYLHPIRHKLRVKPVDASSGATVAVHLAYDKATTLNNSDIGLELKYHDGTNEAHGKWVREIALGPLDSGDRDGFTDVSGSETWNQSFSNPNEETIEVAIPTAQGNGLVEVWVVLMSNETVYFCPEIDVT